MLACDLFREKIVHAKKTAVPRFIFNTTISNFNLSGEFSHSRAFDPPVCDDPRFLYKFYDVVFISFFK